MSKFNEAKFQNLVDILPDWVKGTGSEKCLIQFFVSFFDLNSGQVIGELNQHYEKIALEFAAFLRIIELRELKLLMSNTSFAKPRDGVLHWFHHLEEKKIEPGVYAILGAPFGSNQIATEADARTALSSFSAIISILYGFAALHSKKCELVIDVATGQYSVSSPVIENPAFFKIDHAKDIPLADTFQFSRDLTDAPAESKALIAVALTFIDRAMRESSHGIRVSLYFSALEVLAGETSTNGLCKLLGASHLDLRLMGYDDLLARRTLFVHKGQAIHLKREEERFLQYLVADAMSGKLGVRRSTYAKQYRAALEEIHSRKP